MQNGQFHKRACYIIVAAGKGEADVSGCVFSCVTIQNFIYLFIFLVCVFVYFVLII